ncbi:hypothetical protein ACRWDV_21185 [Escherichia coli]|uniref:hypothetical protein n=1 Tax=Escherichia coli TaxID=562 RepID=UPI0032806A57|nr:hypothetical protein [Escherichia coli]EJM2279020.1 hypothetical protein [Escherichia coli]EKJ4540908.1 hypothetical protein [Escherichia coli]HAV7759797.1 hypothetical protein [Escherichia coli]HCN7092909.1 hypothetical protein [Escherichia coli]
MKDVSANFFDDFYLQVCTACEDKLLELEWKLEVEKKESNQDVLRTYRQRAYDKIEEFKIIEYSKIQCQYFVDMTNSDNIRYSQEFINVDGIMVEKPFIYKETYAEYRIEIRGKMDGYKLTGLARLYDAHYEYIYLSMALEDFYWAQFQYSLGNKKESCKFLLDAYSYMNVCISRDDNRDLPSFYRLRSGFDKVCRRARSSAGGKNKLAELEYIKDTVVILLEDIPLHSDWKNKRQLLEYLMPYICNNDKKVNPDKWINDTGDREETIRRRLNKWSTGDLKVEIDKVLKNNTNN